MSDLREVLKELIEAADQMVNSLPAHWHDDSTIRLTDAANDAREAIKEAEQDDLYEPDALGREEIERLIRVAMQSEELYGALHPGRVARRYTVAKETAAAILATRPGADLSEQQLAEVRTWIDGSFGPTCKKIAEALLTAK